MHIRTDFIRFTFADRPTSEELASKKQAYYLIDDFDALELSFVCTFADTSEELAPEQQACCRDRGGNPRSRVDSSSHGSQHNLQGEAIFYFSHE